MAQRLRTNNLRRHRPGFTIVELLIVIVVVAILATISVVAYNGVQQRTDDAAVQSDVAALVKKIKLLEVDLGAVPPSGQRSHGTGSYFQGITFRPAKSAYLLTQDNLFYCDGDRSGVRVYQVTAKSKSGTVFIYKSDSGFSTATGSSAASNCYAGFDAGTMMYTFGWNLAGSNWFPWTNG